MRLRLVHTLSLWLLAAVGASVLAMGAVTAWNLRQGFGAYLRARDVERLEQFVQVVAEGLRDAGGVQALYERRLDMPALLGELARREGINIAERAAPARPTPQPPFPAPPRRPGPDRPADGQHEGPPEGPRDGPPEGPPGPPRDSRPPPPRLPAPDEGFGGRIALYGLDGRPLIGRPVQPGPEPLVERPVRLAGAIVALARLRPLGRAPDLAEVQFLRSQYLGIAGVAAGLMLLAVAAAWWLARQWARPLQAVQQATARIAQGELGVRLRTTRHDEIGDVMHNVNRMAESLQRIEGARRRWIADMSHELRTPLTVLRGEIEALVDGVRPRTPEAMLSLREDVQRLSRLVDDLHLLAMADLQSLPCHPLAADAVQLLGNALRRFENRAAAAGLTLAWASPPPDRLPVRWDPQRIDQLLANLLENSLRYTDAPGRIELSLARRGERALITLADSAPGVAAADLARLFEPLYRADAARSRHTGGSGLGLAIAEAIVSAHGGRITAHAAALGGLQVEVDLPLSAEGPGA